jgi:hypothetical protein
VLGRDIRRGLLNSTAVHEVDTKAKSLMAVLSPTARQIEEFIPEGPEVCGGG